MIISIIITIEANDIKEREKKRMTKNENLYRRILGDGKYESITRIVTLFSSLLLLCLVYILFTVVLSLHCCRL